MGVLEVRRQRWAFLPPSVDVLFRSAADSVRVAMHTTTDTTETTHANVNISLGDGYRIVFDFSTPQRLAEYCLFNPAGILASCAEEQAPYIAADEMRGDVERAPDAAEAENEGHAEVGADSSAKSVPPAAGRAARPLTQRQVKQKEAAALAEEEARQRELAAEQQEQERAAIVKELEKIESNERAAEATCPMRNVFITQRLADSLPTIGEEESDAIRCESHRRISCDGFIIRALHDGAVEVLSSDGHLLREEAAVDGDKPNGVESGTPDEPWEVTRRFRAALILRRKDAPVAAAAETEVAAEDDAIITPAVVSSHAKTGGRSKSANARRLVTAAGSDGTALSARSIQAPIEESLPISAQPAPRPPVDVNDMFNELRWRLTTAFGRVALWGAPSDVASDNGDVAKYTAYDPFSRSFYMRRVDGQQMVRSTSVVKRVAVMFFYGGRGGGNRQKSVTRESRDRTRFLAKYYES